MSFEKPCFTHTFVASTGLKQYHAVALSGVRLIKPTTEGNIIGILTSSGTTGSTGRAGSTDSGSYQEVTIFGIAKVVAATTTIDAGDTLKASTNGRCSTAGTSTSYRFGIALESVNSTSTSAQTISALITPSVASYA